MKLPKITNPFKKQRNKIVVVSGLPRSGTSMMMQVLQAGGIDALSDNIRIADDNNVKGYHELECVKGLVRGNTSFLKSANGKAIKIVSNLLKHIPADFDYKVIFMRRNLDSILASQSKMLQNLEQAHNPDQDAELRKLYSSHISNLHLWLRSQSNIDVLELDYDDTLDTPKDSLLKLEKFLPYSLNKTLMELSIDKNMNHHRRS